MDALALLLTLGLNQLEAEIGLCLLTHVHEVRNEQLEELILIG